MADDSERLVRATRFSVGTNNGQMYIEAAGHLRASECRLKRRLEKKKWKQSLARSSEKESDWVEALASPFRMALPQGEVVAVMGGFETFVPTVLPTKYEILGDDMQILSIKMDADDLVTAEPGSMNFMHPNVRMSVNCKDCCGRCMSGESCIMATFTTHSNGGYLALTSDVPGKVIPIEMRNVGGKFRSKNGAFFASIGDARVSFDVDCNPVTCCCAGQGLVHQTIVGTDGVAFLSAMGTILQKELADGEVIVIDTYSLVAWEESVKLGIRRAGGCCTCCCGGEGLFNTTLKGPGNIFLQSMSREKFKAALSVASQAGTPNQGENAGGPLRPEVTPPACTMDR